MSTRTRLRVEKTLKMYVGGKFIRSESGRTMPVNKVPVDKVPVNTGPIGTGSAENTGGGVVNAPRASRKDLRDAVRVARAAQAGWAAATAYNRGQILYRLAEMLDDRLAQLPTSEDDAAAAVDRAIHHAGWSDKVTAVLSTLNPVAATYVNYSRVRPLGVVCACPDPAEGLLGIVEAVCASAVMGNGTIVLVDASLAVLTAAFTEVLAVSDLPAGVVNVVTGDRAEMLGIVAAHDDVDGLYLAGSSGAAIRQKLDVEGARVMRRILAVESAARPASPIELAKLSEVQTVWMSAYEPRGGAAAY